MITAQELSIWSSNKKYKEQQGVTAEKISESTHHMNKH
jgi:hypothetical protein